MCNSALPKKFSDKKQYIERGQGCRKLFNLVRAKNQKRMFTKWQPGDVILLRGEWRAICITGGERVRGSLFCSVKAVM